MRAGLQIYRAIKSKLEDPSIRLHSRSYSRSPAEFELGKARPDKLISNSRFKGNVRMMGQRVVLSPPRTPVRPCQYILAQPCVEQKNHMADLDRNVLPLEGLHRTC
jgi:hypothetical protein